MHLAWSELQQGYTHTACTLTLHQLLLRRIPSERIQYFSHDVEIQVAGELILEHFSSFTTT